MARSSPVSATDQHPILIVGTGAMATLFAGRLGLAGRGVTMLGSWSPGLSSLRERGARLVDGRGNENAVPVRAVQDPAECRGLQQAIVLVKAWQTADAARSLAQCLSPDGLALTLQNGLGNYEVLAQALGPDRVTLGTTTSGATLLGPGLVRPSGNGAVSIQAHPRLAPLQQALQSAGFSVHIVEDAKALLWGKLVVNCSINPLTALLRVTNGELLQRASARALMRALAEETAAVARAAGVQLAFSNPADKVEEVASQTAGNYSSMLQDIQRGAPTEIDAICGAVSRVGRAHGVPTPLNDACWQLVSALSPARAELAASQPVAPR